MALPPSGNISLEDVQDEFAGNYVGDDTSSLSKASAFYFGSNQALTDFRGKGMAQARPDSLNVIDSTIFPSITSDPWNNLSSINTTTSNKATNTGTSTFAAAVAIPMTAFSSISGTVESIMVQIASVSRSSLGSDGQSRAPDARVHLSDESFSGGTAPIGGNLFPRTNVGSYRTQTYFPSLSEILFSNSGFISSWNADNIKLTVAGSSASKTADIEKLNSNDRLEIYFARMEVLYSTI